MTDNALTLSASASTTPFVYKSFKSPYILFEELLPHGRRSLERVATNSFLLGLCVGFGLTLILIGNFAYNFSKIHEYVSWLIWPKVWRVSVFMVSLALFHFLEFWAHARRNVTNATVSAFLLSNGCGSFQLAHACAFFEILVHKSPRISNVSTPHGFFLMIVRISGLILVVTGQIIRTCAMLEAGTNFNHLIQIRRSADHVLVTTGVYRYLRHPAYFGFFWWALGTQLLVGNHFCLIVYTIVLWRFFYLRILEEEETLINFFGQHYLKYKATTRTGIPFVV